MSCSNQSNQCPNCEDSSTKGIEKCYRNFCAYCLAELPEDGEWGRICEGCQHSMRVAEKMANVTGELISQIMGGSTWGR
jgi:hypothetical protein